MTFAQKAATLREQQSSLNAQIDAYEKASQVPESQITDLKALEHNINTIASRIVATTTDPINAVFDGVLSMTLVSTLRTAIDINLFEILGDSTGLDEIQHKTGAEDKLLSRLLRHLVAFDYARETAENVFQSTPLSQALTIPSLRDWVKITFDAVFPILAGIPQYLKRTGHKNPSDLSDSLSMHVYGIPSFFDYLSKDPQRQRDFDSAMKLQEAVPKDLVPDYPFADSRLQINSNDIMIVDVGGGRGQALEAIQEKYQLPGRLVLQDLEVVVNGIQTPTNVFEKMPHDFFTTQPLTGARYYHARRVLHDWPDTACSQILQQTARAMKRGYSTLLISENVLPDTGCPPREACMDINMMAGMGMERSETQWRALLATAGLEIIGITRPKVGFWCIIEAGLV